MGRCIARLMLWVLGAAAVGLPAQGQPQLDSSAVTAGVGFLDTDQWGAVRSAVSNPTEAPAAPLLTVSFDGNPTLLFGYDVWLPPQSQRKLIVPVRPTREPRVSQGNAFSVQTRLIDTSGTREQLLSRAEPSLLIAARGEATTGIISGRYSAPNMAVATLRETLGMPPTTSSVRQEIAPPMAEAWRSLDALAVAAEDIEMNPAQIAALRQWVYGGGRLWILLDSVDPSFPGRLLGDYWRVARLGDADLVDFTIDEVEGGEAKEQTRVRSEYPLKMVRVVPEGFNVTHKVGGYAAAFRRQIGKGEVLVTTLEPRAWVVGNDQATTSLADLTWMIRGSGRTLATPAATDTSLLPFVKSQIGTRILERHTVIIVLGGFTLALLIAGIILSRQGRMEYAALVGAIMAVITAAVLVGLGLSRQLEYPTLASMQVVRFDARMPIAHAEGAAGVYQPQAFDAVDAQLHGESGAMAWPDLQGQGASNVRMIFQDPLTWRFELKLPQGAVQSLQTTTQRQVIDRPQVQMAYTPEGLAGSIEPGEAEAIHDALIVGGGGAMYARIQNGQVSTSIDDAATPGQYVSGTVLTSEQMVRQDAYRSLLSDPSFSNEPALVGWSTDLPLSVGFRDDAVRNINSLVVVPLELRRPEPGQTVAVPAALMPMTTYRGKSGGTVYDATNRTWIPNIATPQTVYMSFELPEGVEDLEPTGGLLTLDVTAPGWQVQVVTVDNANQDVVLATRQSPLGTVTIDLDQGPINQDGHLVLGLAVQPLEGATGGGDRWTVERLILSARGRVPSRGATSE